MATNFQDQNPLTNRRSFLKGLTALAGTTSIISLLDACGGTASSASNGPVKLRFAVLPQQAELDNANKFIAAFNKKYPNVQVAAEQLTGDYHQKLTLQAASNSLPDLFWIEDQAVRTFSSKGIMLELDPYIKKSGFDTSNIYPSMLALGQNNGKQYMLPRDYNHLVTYYNIDMFKAANVPIPQDGWTWEEFTNAAQKLTKKDAKGKTTQYGVDGGNFNWWAIDVPAIRGYGGDVVTSDGKVVVNSSQASQGIDALYQLVKNGVATNFAENPSGSATFPGFATNQAAMVLHVRPLVQSYMAASQGKFTFNVATFPIFPASHKVGAGTSGYAISAKTAHPDEAWQLLSFIDSPEGQKVFEATGNSVPVLQSLQSDSTWLLPNLNNKAFFDTPSADTLPIEFQLPAAAGGPVDTARTMLLTKVFLGQITASQFVSQWADQINQAIKDAQ